VLMTRDCHTDVKYTGEAGTEHCEAKGRVKWDREGTLTELMESRTVQELGSAPCHGNVVIFADAAKEEHGKAGTFVYKEKFSRWLNI